jgi:hypothetical protein
MKHWMLGGVAVVGVGVAVYFATTWTEPVPVPVHPPPPPVVAAPPSVPPAPVVLAEVIDVANIDPLLDPPARPVTGAPFDADPAVVPARATTTVPIFIPPAREDDALEVAPMPRLAPLFRVPPGIFHTGVGYFF